jgi:acyl transferase domain-containing protein
MSWLSLVATCAGVKLILTPSLSAMFQRAGMLALDGRCKTLDAAADGYVRGEAAAAILLQAPPAATKPATRGAKALFGSQPVAIITGSAVNQDGRSSALTAPNGPAQQSAIRAALLAASIAPGAVAGLQMHGTGTPLGDPIELGAALAVLREQAATSSTDRGTYSFADNSNRGAPGLPLPLVLSSDKSSVGHTEPAAGLVGMLHAVFSTQASVTQPVLHLCAVNPHIAALLGQVPSAGNAGQDSDMYGAGTRQTPGSQVFMPRSSGPGGLSSSQGRDQASALPARFQGVSSFAFQVCRGCSC